MSLYRLSKLIPIRFTSEYGWGQDGIPIGHERASWWQWRNHILRHRVFPATGSPKARLSD